MSNPNKNAVDLTDLIKDKFTMRKDIAPVETSATASRAYKVGDKFYYGNLLQEATQDIAQGGTLTLNTNYKNADPVTTSIQNLSTVVSKNGAKNLLPFDLEIAKKINTNGTWSGNSYTHSGITFTPEVDDKGNLLYVNVNGTNSSTITASMVFWNTNVSPFYLQPNNYILTGTPSGGGNDAYNCYVKNGNNYEVDSGNGKEFTISSASQGLAFVMGVGKGQTVNNIKYYPMIRLASDTDPTYEPYAKTNQQLTKETTGLIDNQNVNGAVNMAPINLTTQVDGIYSYTVAADKTISAVVSSATSLTIKVISPVFTLKTGTYKLSGTPVMSGSTADLQLLYSDDSAVIATEYNNQGKVFTLTTDTSVKLRIVWHSNVAAGTYVFKPMITVPSYIGPYVPYAKNNKELTEDVEKADHYVSGESFGGSNGAIIPIGCSNAAGTSIYLQIPLPKNVLEAVSVPSGKYNIPINWVRANGQNITSGLTVDTVTLLRPGMLGLTVSGTFSAMTLYAVSLGSWTVIVP